MCIILDANCLGDFRNRSNEDLQPVRKWLDERNGNIAYSDTDKFRSEWKRGGLDYRTLNRAGQLKLIPGEEVLAKQRELTGQLESDDPHVIALAIVARIRVLVVQRQKMEPRKGKKRPKRSADTDLVRDFKEVVRGKVYLNKAHKHLLTRDTCP